jgi:hypothetical protein
MASADVGPRQQRPDARDLLDSDRRGVRSSRLSDSSDRRLKRGRRAGLPRLPTRSPAYSPLPPIRPARLRRFAVLHDHQAKPMPRLSFFNMGGHRSTRAPREGPGRVNYPRVAIERIRSEEMRGCSSIGHVDAQARRGSGGARIKLPLAASNPASAGTPDAALRAGARSRRGYGRAARSGRGGAPRLRCY